MANPITPRLASSLPIEEALPCITQAINRLLIQKSQGSIVKLEEVGVFISLGEICNTISMLGYVCENIPKEEFKFAIDQFCVNGWYVCDPFGSQNYLFKAKRA